MKPNELRIGNIVFDTETGQIDTITAIEKLSLVSLQKSCSPYTPIDKISPVKLTEEWLLRFGFEESIDSDGGLIMQLPGTNFYLEYMSFPGNVFESGYQFYCESTKEGHRLCGHVHQLQNLFFALTDQELILKPKKETA